MTFLELLGAALEVTKGFLGLHQEKKAEEASDEKKAEAADAALPPKIPIPEEPKAPEKE